MRRVLAVFGTRPDTIKMMPVVEKLRETDGIRLITLATAQHRQMLDDVLRVFSVEPDYDLDMMRPEQSLSDIVTRGLPLMMSALKETGPELVLVHGDTSTGFVASLAAFYSGVKVGHVEAGLRTYDKLNPFPEEMNRKLIGALADLHFAPLSTHKANLEKEGVRADDVFVTGNTAVDAVLETASRVRRFEDKEVGAFAGLPGRMILVTAHRRESIGDGIKGICLAVRRLLEKHEDLRVIFPVHPNPKVSATVRDVLGDVRRCLLTAPLSYPDMVMAIKSSYFCMSDSGGVQEEAPSLGKPVLVLRKVTERQEGLASGTLKLAGVDPDEITRLADELLENPEEHARMAGAKNPFGDGEAAERIKRAVLFSFGMAGRPGDFN